MKVTELPAGISSRPEFFMRFALWAEQVERFISPEMIANHFGVSRATSYRWLEAWRSARGAT